MKILRKIAKSNNKSLPENVIFEDMELKKEEETHKVNTMYFCFVFLYWFPF